MPFHYPRRMKDLPAFESDSEDELKTPQRPNTKAISDAARKKEENKENESACKNITSNNFIAATAATATKSQCILPGLRIPKRTSELPAFDSDSDDDDNRKNENLDCAILDQSFVESPTRSSHSGSDNGGQPRDMDAKNASSSLLARFNKMALSTASKPATVETVTPYVQRLQNIQEYNEAGGISGAVQRFASDPIYSRRQQDMETPLKAMEKHSSAIVTTTASTNDAQFITPQVRSFSVQRRPTRDLYCTQTRSANVNEFRSQKVLFQTPMATARKAPPPANDSISLSLLCDTINQAGSTTPNDTAETPLSGKAQSVVKSNKTTEPQNDHKPATPEICRTSSSRRAKKSCVQINGTAYTVLSKLGCGGSSSVYHAVCKDSGRECALKVVDLHGEASVVEGYLNETKMLAKLQGNICVVALYDYQLLRTESKLFLVMEKGNSDLHKILQGYDSDLPLYMLTNYLYQMLQAVSYIHQHGVIHSDLKPANFLMVRGRLKLIDFGIASNISNDSTSIIKFSQAGTFNYISPEALIDTSTGGSQMQPSIKISTKADVWSLGCILYLFMFKRTPFSHLKNIHAKIRAISHPQPPIEYPTLPPYYPPMYLHMARNCLQHEPKKRPSCAELLQYPFDMIIPLKDLEVPLPVSHSESPISSSSAGASTAASVQRPSNSS